MKKYLRIFTAAFFGLSVQAATAASDISPLLQQYATQGATTPNAGRGKQLWQATFRRGAADTERSCTSCHSQDLTANGKHISTGKLIEPMASSVNPQRLTDINKVEKWFTRNCRWTMNRDCSPQEKADFVLYLNQ